MWMVSAVGIESRAEVCEWIEEYSMWMVSTVAREFGAGVCEWFEEYSMWMVSTVAREFGAGVCEWLEEYSMWMVSTVAREFGAGVCEWFEENCMWMVSTVGREFWSRNLWMVRGVHYCHNLCEWLVQLVESLLCRDFWLLFCECFLRHVSRGFVNNFIDLLGRSL